MLVRLQHLYAVGEDPEQSASSKVDVAALLSSLRGGCSASAVVEMSLSGLVTADEASAGRRHFPTEGSGGDAHPWTEQQSRGTNGGGGKGEDEATTVRAFELRTFLVV